MKPEAIFAPVSVLALWTGAIALLTGVLRVVAVARGRMSVNALRPGESAEVPADVALANRNYMNLLEMPVLFYTGSLALYVTGHVDAAVIELAWAFVALRLLHSLIHLTYNRVTHRLVPFALSGFVLLAMWIMLIVRTL
jgi:hypothetical protein